jgi:hypothetical protein
MSETRTCGVLASIIVWRFPHNPEGATPEERMVGKVRMVEPNPMPVAKADIPELLANLSPVQRETSVAII